MNPFWYGLLTCTGFKLLGDYFKTPMGQSTKEEAVKLFKDAWKNYVPKETRDKIEMSLAISGWLYDVGASYLELYKFFDALIGSAGEALFEFYLSKDTIILKVNGEPVAKVPYQGELQYVKAGGIDLPKPPEEEPSIDGTEGTFELPEVWTYSTWSYSAIAGEDYKRERDIIEGILALCVYYSFYVNFSSLDLPKNVKIVINCEEEYLGTFPSFIIWRKYYKAIEEFLGIYEARESVAIPEIILEQNCSPKWRVLKEETLEVIGEN